jgi:peptidase C13-like protein
MTFRLVARLPSAVLIFCLLMDQAAPGAATTNPAAKWQVVLAAGDDAEPVFDNATRTLSQRLAAAGVPATNIRRLSASAAELGAGVEPALASVLLQRIAALPARPGDRCLIFLTSHGARGAGLWLARSNTTLSPDELAQALSRGCAAVPTVVVISACYSGAFAAGKMAKPNRIVLTAARNDRPSFGCQVHRVYNFFDECLLGALPKSATWRAVFDGSKACVRHMEHALGERPSEPQAYFGATVANLNVGF